MISKRSANDTNEGERPKRKCTEVNNRRSFLANVTSSISSRISASSAVRRLSSNSLDVESNQGDISPIKCCVRGCHSQVTLFHNKS